MPGGTICRGYCLVFEPDPSWPEELDLVRERAGRAVSASLGLDLTAVVRHDWQHGAKLRHDTIGNTTPKYDYNDLLAPARNSMVLLEECEPLVFAVALSSLACYMPVSYTHLTLPTIYSV